MDDAEIQWLGAEGIAMDIDLNMNAQAMPWPSATNRGAQRVRAAVQGRLKTLEMTMPIIGTSTASSRSSV